MILPSKSISPERSLIALGSEILGLLRQSPLTISSVWTELHVSEKTIRSTPTGFDWFVLALDMLYALDAIELQPSGVLTAVES